MYQGSCAVSFLQCCSIVVGLLRCKTREEGTPQVFDGSPAPGRGKRCSTRGSSLQTGATAEHGANEVGQKNWLKHTRAHIHARTHARTHTCTRARSLAHTHMHARTLARTYLHSDEELMFKNVNQPQSTPFMTFFSVMATEIQATRELSRYGQFYSIH